MIPLVNQTYGFTQQMITPRLKLSFFKCLWVISNSHHFSLTNLKPIYSNQKGKFDISTN